MNVSGKVLKANIVRGRDAYELELRIQLTDGKCDVYAPTSGYVGNLASVGLADVPAAYWDKDPAAEPKSPAPADFAPVPLPIVEPPSPAKEREAPADLPVEAAPLPLPAAPPVKAAPAEKAPAKKKEI